MKERERNKRLQKLIETIGDDQELMELLATMVNNDTESMKMTFKLWTKASPIASFLGVDNLSQLTDSQKLDIKKRESERKLNIHKNWKQIIPEITQEQSMECEKLACDELSGKNIGKLNHYLKKIGK